MGLVYIIILLFCRVVQALFNKKSSCMVNSIPMVIKYNGFRQCISAIMALALVFMSKQGFAIDSMTVILSVVAGMMIVISLSCSLYAMKSGMVALVSLFSTAGMIVPCIAGIFLFGIPVKAMQWIGILIFMVAAYLMIMGSKQTLGEFSLKTLLLLLTVLLADGFTMVVQQMYMRCVPDGNVSMFSFLSFGIIGLVFLGMVPIVSKFKPEESKPMSKKLLVYGLVLAAALLVMNQVVTIAAVTIPPVILFAFANGGGTVAAAIAAAVAYKEKLTAKSIVGIVLGILALFVIKIFE